MNNSALILLFALMCIPLYGTLVSAVGLIIGIVMLNGKHKKNKETGKTIIIWSIALILVNYVIQAILASV